MSDFVDFVGAHLIAILSVAFTIGIFITFSRRKSVGPVDIAARSKETEDLANSAQRQAESGVDALFEEFERKGNIP